MNSIIFVLALSMTEARHIRQKQPVISLYAKSGRHLALSSTGQVHLTLEPNSKYSALEKVSAGDNQFYMRSVETGRYLAAKKSKSTRRRLLTTVTQTGALKFTEELLSNYFNSYALYEDNSCRMTAKKNGKVLMVCRKRHRKSEVSFLPRRIHLHWNTASICTYNLLIYIIYLFQNYLSFLNVAAFGLCLTWLARLSPC